ncbi:V-type proton ATPase subunit H [Zancudomyces culisetae]|uniref:V-type proton ATPase subunit H n=1 Tax=Zancudomyces culisetae TaxID=1213189 RepID=A0A1R1PCP6_ZANCU|nr:V-type proton ATPase subunit H [Zancudomyces culisetae]|eukprot:OMH78744.1 V-type proton ATPase subunit H [Zancudomyces culisetae]
MVVCGVRGCLEALQGRKYSDNDLTTDISELVGVLDEQANRINEGEREEGSWALYVNQVKSGILTMGQTQHYDDKFWKSNAKRMEEKDGYVIRKLVEHLMSIKNTETEQEKLAIICHDIGMYLKYSHNSMQAKKLLDGLGAKKKIMELLLESNDNNATGGSGSGSGSSSSAGSGKYQQMVRYEALNTIHYFMMNAWENSSVNLTTNTGSVNAS